MNYLNDLVQALVPVIGLAVNVLIQLISLKSIPKISLLKTIVIGFFFGFASILSIGWNNPYVLIANSIAYIFLGYCYFSFLGLVDYARRTVMLRQLEKVETGLSLEEISVRCGAGEMASLRLKRLLTKGHITLQDNRYYMRKQTLVIVAKVVTLMKLLVVGKKSEFVK